MSGGTTPFCLRLNEVEHRYRSGPFVLGPVNAQTTVGVTCLLGANGAGKSTLFRIIAGIDHPTSGTVSVDAPPTRDKIGYLPQTFLAPDRARCDDYLRYVAWMQGVPSGSRDARIAEALAAVGLADKSSAKIKQLSGGMRRRLGIAQAVIHHPALVLLDEPTAGLDLDQRVRVADAVRSVAEDSIVVVATHILDDVTRMANSVLALEAGQLKFTGTREDLLEIPVLAEPTNGGTDLDMLRSLEGLLRRGDDS